MADVVDCVVVGAGVVGLAAARALALQGREVLVLEAAEAIGTGTSSRNSEVIHAGLYYAPGSLKARLCVRGKELLYALCASHGVDHRRCGKLTVANSEAEVQALRGLQDRAAANGVPAEFLALASAVLCHRALLGRCPRLQTGEAEGGHAQTEKPHRQRRADRAHAASDRGRLGFGGRPPACRRRAAARGTGRQDPGRHPPSVRR